MDVSEMMTSLKSSSSYRFKIGDRWRNSDLRLSSFDSSQASLSGVMEMNMNMKSPRLRRMSQVGMLHWFALSVFRVQLPMNPNSTTRLVWDFLGLFLISWDVLFIPFELAFDPDTVTFTTVVSWIILIYWSIDVIMSNLVGFYENGELIMGWRRIFFKYLRTWFVIDVLVLGPDWFLKILAATAEGSSTTAQDRANGRLDDVANALRSLRVLRVVRLLRLLKLQRAMNLVYDTLDSEYVFILFTLLKLTCLISVLNHVIACIWYATGRISMEQGELNWLENSATDKPPIINGSLVYQYTTSLHWSLTQFTPASMDTFARNVPERIVSIVVVFFASIGFSSIVGSVTNSVAQLQALHGNSRRQFWLLRKYLNEKQIFEPTRSRLFQFLEHEVEKRRQDVKAEDVKLLPLLSSPLENLLSYELNKGPIKGHPFFGRLELHMQPIMYRFCHAALKHKHFAIHDTCFRASEESKYMWFIIEGSFNYTLRGDMYQLSTGSWLAEPAIWTAAWWHRGKLQVSSTSGRLAYVSPAALASCCKVHPRPWLYARKYGIKFVKTLNESEVPISDLPTVDTDTLKRMVVESDEMRHESPIA